MVMRHVIITKYIKCEELVRVPQSMRAEMIVVDNGSEDSTASVIRAARHPQMELQMVIENLSLQEPGADRRSGGGKVGYITFCR